jgi:hypothetical protein
MGMASRSLVIDASTVVFQAGILEGDRFSTFSATKDDTLAGFFPLLAPFLKDFRCDEIIFCEGPGKLIGIRTTLMLVHILKIVHPHSRIYSYDALVLANRIRNRLSVPAEGLICASKSSAQYYIFEDGHITVVDTEHLRCRKNPLYCLATHHRETTAFPVIPLTYDLRDHIDFLPTIIAPNPAISTAYDPLNDYKKWVPLRHGGSKEL